MITRLIAAALMTLPALAQVPPERLERLRTGVNVSHWFWLSRAASDQERDAFFTSADAKSLAAAGFTHVRLPVEPSWLWDNQTHTLRSENLVAYRKGVALLHAAGLAVVIDPHPAQSPWVQPRDEASMREYAAFWSALAASLADLDPSLTFFEVMNEPHDLSLPETWNAAQSQIAAAIRAAAPDHTIIATGDEWGGIAGLARCKPLADANVVYSFHFYEPHTFTHQGATWGAPNWQHLKNVPYPADTQRIDASLDLATSKDARAELLWYEGEDWDQTRIQLRIAQAAAWAAEHEVSLYCGEFGAYRQTCPPADRLLWLSHVAGALADQGIAWAMWDYAGGFALTNGEPGDRDLDQPTLEALGLTKADAAQGSEPPKRQPPAATPPQ